MLAGAFGCTRPARTPLAQAQIPDRKLDDAAFLDDLQLRTFRFFWERADPETGLMPDRWPTKSFHSVAAVGFALTAYPIGAERGFVTRADAADRVLTTLRFMMNARQDSAVSGSTGYRGFYYHFLDDSGQRFETVELSTIDTALLLAGALFCQTYFDRDDATEDRIRELADALYERVDWTWAQVRAPSIVLGWKPESGFLPYDYRGYNETMLLQILALASPTHPVGKDSWDEWISAYEWGEFYGYEHLGFPPLFGHQYTQVWIDSRGIQDEPMRARGIDYFENSRRAALAQHAYAIDNPQGFAGYGPLCWGLTACDGPVSVEITIDGRTRAFQTYWARGASFRYVNDDGTICPSAAGGSVPFAPEITIPALRHMKDTYGANVYGEYGFLDAFNPTLREDITVQHGRVDTTLGWFDTDYLGIDQGPILAMIENYRTGLVWNTMRRNPHVVR
ncbi:MAG: Tat pathway signal protein, partial [Gemmatimonadetes bacterium]|nr:Tat pathway signal protein [Gemmatimonadota bacterium]